MLETVANILLSYKPFTPVTCRLPQVQVVYPCHKSFASYQITASVNEATWYTHTNLANTITASSRATMNGFLTSHTHTSLHNGNSSSGGDGDGGNCFHILPLKLRGPVRAGQYVTYYFLEYVIYTVYPGCLPPSSPPPHSHYHLSSRAHRLWWRAANPAVWSAASLGMWSAASLAVWSAASLAVMLSVQPYNRQRVSSPNSRLSETVLWSLGAPVKSELHGCLAKQNSVAHPTSKHWKEGPKKKKKKDRQGNEASALSWTLLKQMPSWKWNTPLASVYLKP